MDHWTHNRALLSQDQVACLMAFGGQRGHCARSNRLPRKSLNGDKQPRINNIGRNRGVAGFPRSRLLVPVTHLLVDCLKAQMSVRSEKLDTSISCGSCRPNRI
jgi:hypothetical protein